MMVKIIKDSEFERVAEGIKPDAKKRIVLSKTIIPNGVTYHIYANSLGQIILDPQITVPASEAWLFQNTEVLASLRRGLKDAREGRVKKVNLKDL
jgi:hypothetical protein